MNVKVSAVILAKNEEKNIRRAIESVKFCDEIIVIDDYSNDKTVKIAKELGAAVYEHKLDDDFAAQRNFGMEKARGEWVLFIDADEKVTDELKHQILSAKFQINPKPKIQNSKKSVEVYYIKRRDIFWGREVRFGEAGNTLLIRLVRKGKGKWMGKVHERFVTSGATADLNSFLLHYPHETISDFLSEINSYSSLRAEELWREGKKVSLLTIIAYPSAKFLINYIGKLGFLDGPVGFVYAFMMSFHSFLVRAKLYLKSHSSLR